MKLLLAIPVGLALAVGASSSAFGQAHDILEARAFDRADLAPFLVESPRYPSRAGRAHEPGVCTVRFDIAADGGVENPEPLACTSSDFEREAIRVVSALRYPKNAGGPVIRGREITFRWLGETGDE